MTGERENLHGGGTLLRRTSVFTRGENFGAGGIDFCRALKSLAITKKKDTLFSVSFFLDLVEAGGVEPPSENASAGTSPGADGHLHSLALA